MFSCAEPEINMKTNQYFDTDGFIEESIDFLIENDFNVTKHVTLNGKTETIYDVALNREFLTESFSLLKSSNINKASLVDKYEIDSTFFMNKPIVNYMAKEEDLKVQNMFVSEGMVGARQVASNFMTSYDKTISYVKGNSILIQGWQKSMMSDTMRYETKIVFKKVVIEQ